MTAKIAMLNAGESAIVPHQRTIAERLSCASRSSVEGERRIDRRSLTATAALVRAAIAASDVRQTAACCARLGTRSVAKLVRR